MTTEMRTGWGADEGIDIFEAGAVKKVRPEQSSPLGAPIYQC